LAEQRLKSVDDRVQLAEARNAALQAQFAALGEREGQLVAQTEQFKDDIKRIRDLEAWQQRLAEQDSALNTRLEEVCCC
jgi:hypothetical protein